MFLTINGRPKEVDPVQTVAGLLTLLGVDRQQVVVELNEKVIRRNQVADTPIQENDFVEILRFVGGG
jgi:thiamine biosynthesis protein ThiS